MRIKNYLFCLIFFTLIGNIETVTASDIIRNNSEPEYRPFVEEGKQWLVVCATYKVFWTKKYYISNDTIIGSHSCKKLLCQIEDYVEKTTNIKLHSYVYEVNKKVYYIAPEDISGATPIMLYDFSAKIGDTLQLGGHDEDLMEQKSYYIQNKLSLQNNDECFNGVQAGLVGGKEHIIDNDTVGTLFQWYESIGSVFEPFLKTEWNNYMSGPLYHLYECKVHDNIIYSNTMGIVLAYDSVTANDISATKLLHNGQIYIIRGDKTYTLTGQEVK